MLRRILITAAIIAAAGLIWISRVTTPASVDPFVVLLVFGMIYVLALTVLTFFIYWGYRLIVRLFRLRRGAGDGGMTLYRAYLFGSVAAFAPVALLAMRSVGQQNVGDVLLVMLFEVLACFYVWRRS